MFVQVDINNNNYDSNNYSEYSNYSNYSFELKPDIYNSSNFSITSDPINYYTKDNLKQNSHNLFSQLQQQQQQQLRNQIHSLRKIQSQNYLKKHKIMLKYKNDKNNEKHNNNNKSICKNIGFDSGLNKNTPFINYLINKRINFCELGSSSHIAAFIPVSNNSWYYFIRKCKRKDNYG